MSDLASLQQRALTDLRACTDEAALRAWNTRYLKGELDQAMKDIGKLPPAERPRMDSR